MSAKESELNSLSRAIADLEAVDAALAVSGPDGSAPKGPVAEARLQLRAAIATLASAQAAGDETATTKRRVKIKAASDATPASAENGKPAGKSGAKRGERARANAVATPAPAAPPTLSLLARLGAAAAPPSEPEKATVTSPPASAGISAEDAANRLARLEAEIDSLTKPPSSAGTAPTARHGDSASPAASPTPPASVPPARAPLTSAPSTAPEPAARATDTEVDDEEAQITIVGADPTTGGRAARSSRLGQITHTGSPPPDDDDAEVEIVRPGESSRQRPGAAQSERLRLDPGAPTFPAKGATPSRWRLFRGS